MRCIFFGWVLLSSFYLRGDTPDSCKYHRIICQALSLCEQHQWQQALQFTTTYLSQEGNGSIEEAVVAHQILGDCHLELFEYDLAKRAYDVAKGLLKPGIGQREQLADVLQKLGNYYLVAKDYATAIPYLDTSLLFRRELYGNEHLKVGDVLNNLGVAYLNLGDFARAEDYHHQALSIRAQGLPSASVNYAQSLNNLALCHQDQGQLNIAVTLLNDARRAYESSGSLHQNQIADVYLNLGNVYSDSSQWGQAIDMYKEAKVRFQDDALAQALCNNNMANAHTRLGGQEIAMRHYSDALRLRKEYLGLRHPDVAETYFNIGMNYFFREQMTEAILYLDSCAIAVGFDLSADPDLLEVSDFRTLLYLLYRKAEVYKVFYEDGQDVEWLERASEIYEQIDVLFDHLRSTYKAIQSKQELLAIAHHVYDQGIQVLYQLFSTTNEARHLHVAFKYSEKSKGILLLEALQKTKANSFLNIPQSTLDSIRIMEENIANLEKGRFLLVQAEYDKGRKVLDSLSAAILWSKRALSRRISEIATQFPEYHSLRYETVPPSVSYIQQMLVRNDESLISYFLGDGYVMIFLVNRDDFEVRKVRIDSSFFDVCNVYLNSIQDFQHVSSDRVEDNVQTYIHAATSLLEALIDPIQSHLNPALIIVPDGQLGFLPFEAFLTGPVSDANHFREYPYLVKSYAVSYNYSVRALQEMKQKGQSTGLKPYLGLAPKFSRDSTQGLLPLVHNEAEVLAAKSTLGGKVLLSGEATKKAFLNLQSNYRILHLATHALSDSQADDFSFIAFENIEQGREASSLLYVREIYNLSAPADMVILSACETAAGRLYLGDGIASIARGFSFAGAKSLLATRWNINDKTTQSLMAKFLEEIKSGRPKGQALQMATTAFIRESSSYHAHPFFWASFMGIGSMEAIDFPPTTWPWIIALSCLVLATILYLRRQRSDRTVDV